MSNTVVEEPEDSLRHYLPNFDSFFQVDVSQKIYPPKYVSPIIATTHYKIVFT